MRTPSRHHDVSRGAAIAVLVLGAALAVSPQAAGRSAAPSGMLPPVLVSGPPYWLPVASMHTRRARFAAAVGPDGRIYALGGVDATVEAYLPKTNTWAGVASLPQPYDGFAAATGPDSRIYAIGVPATNVLAYRPGQDRWVIADGTTAVSHDQGAATIGPDGRIYAIGGDNADDLVAAVEALDTHTGLWSRVADLPTPRGNLAAATGLDGRMYTLGGAVGKAQGARGFATVEAYSVRTGLGAQKRWGQAASRYSGWCSCQYPSHPSLSCSVRNAARASLVSTLHCIPLRFWRRATIRSLAFSPSPLPIKRRCRRRRR